MHFEFRYYAWNVAIHHACASLVLTSTCTASSACVRYSVSVAGRRVEAAMGIESFAVMAALVNLACGILCSTALFALYVLTRYEVRAILQEYHMILANTSLFR